MQKHILVVDDDPIMLRLMRMYLQEHYKVSIVNSGKTAIQFLGKHIPDIILLDYLMPEQDGLETYQQIKQIEECKDIPIIFLTGLTNKEKYEATLSLHPYGVIMKPVEQEKLLDILAAI